MKNVRLVSLSIRNFKGIRELNLSFSELETTIAGANGTGKTTIADAFSFLLYGKDSQNSATFDIKTLNPDNTPIHNLEHEVMGVLEVCKDGTCYRHELKRIYKEKWVKKKGADVSEMDGHVQTFFYNDVPVSLAEYKSKVDSIISEEVSRLITNPIHFNTALKWQDRRVILSRMAGDLSNNAIADSINASEELRGLLTSGKTLAEHKRELSAKRLRLKAQLDQIPSRIDEVDRSKPAALDWEKLESEQQRIQSEIEEIDGKLRSAEGIQNEAFESIRQAKNARFGKEQALSDLKGRLDREFSATGAGILGDMSRIDNDISIKNQSIGRHNARIEELQTGIDKSNERLDAIRGEWDEWNSKEWSVDPASCECPTCKRRLDQDQVEKIISEGQANFDQHVEDNMTRLTDEANRIKGNIEKDQSEIKRLKGDIEFLQKQVKDLESELDGKQTQLENLSTQKREETEEEKAMQKEIDGIVIPDAPTTQSDETLHNRRSELASELDRVKSDIATKSQIEKAEARTQELRSEERTLSQEIADIERTEMSIDKFNRARIETIESRISSMFEPINVGTRENPVLKHLRFKMFDQQINGGESETCECIVDGVPFSSLNNAMRVNAGISIINAMIGFYEIAAPIFIDNRESVVDLHPTSAQVINLVVNKKYKTLTVVDTAA